MSHVEFDRISNHYKLTDFTFPPVLIDVFIKFPTETIRDNITCPALDPFRKLPMIFNPSDDLVN